LIKDFVAPNEELEVLKYLSTLPYCKTFNIALKSRLTTKYNSCRSNQLYR